MTNALRAALSAADQPVERITEAAGLYFRSLWLPVAGMVVAQHVHDYDHATLVGSGRARGYCDGQLLGEKGRGEVFEITAGCAHAFEAVEPETLLVCVHDLASALSVKRKGL